MTASISLQHDAFGWLPEIMQICCGLSDGLNMATRGKHEASTGLHSQRAQDVRFGLGTKST